MKNLTRHDLVLGSTALGAVHGMTSDDTIAKLQALLARGSFGDPNRATRWFRDSTLR